MLESRTQNALKPGFDDPVRDSQRVFRAVLAAMSRPGKIVELPESPALPAFDGLPQSALAALLALADLETPVLALSGMDAAGLADYLGFHCGCPAAKGPEEAAFILVDGARFEENSPEFARLPRGDALYPDRSATVVMAVPGLGGGLGPLLHGPGINGEAVLEVEGLPESFWEFARNNADLYPLGLDFIFTRGSRLACLPRSIRPGAMSRLGDAPCT